MPQRLFFFFFLPLSGQNISTAQLNGVVRDQSGAVIAGATVTVTDASKGFSRIATTNGQGNYQFSLLPPGKYTVHFDANGMNPFEEHDVVLTVGEQAQLPVKMPIGGVRELVIVKAGADVTETQRSSQSTAVDQTRIENLPTNGRNYVNFTLTNSIQATNPFSTVNQPAYTRVRGGFTVGGAIVPDKTFYSFRRRLRGGRRRVSRLLGRGTLG